MSRYALSHYTRCMPSSDFVYVPPRWPKQKIAKLEFWGIGVGISTAHPPAWKQLKLHNNCLHLTYSWLFRLAQDRTAGNFYTAFHQCE